MLQKRLMEAFRQGNFQVAGSGHSVCGIDWWLKPLSAHATNQLPLALRLLRLGCMHVSQVLTRLNTSIRLKHIDSSYTQNTRVVQCTEELMYFNRDKLSNCTSCPLLSSCTSKSNYLFAITWIKEKDNCYLLTLTISVCWPHSKTGTIIDSPACLHILIVVSPFNTIRHHGKVEMLW